MKPLLTRTCFAAATLLAASSANASVIPTSGLVAYYDFEGTGGTEFSNKAVGGNGVALTATGVTAGAPGTSFNGNAGIFDGTTTSKLESLTTSASLGSNYTISGSFFFNNGASLPRQMAWEGKNTYDVSLGMTAGDTNDDGQVTLRSWINQSTNQDATVSTGQWINITQVITNGDSITASPLKTIDTYINGVLAFSQTNSATNSLDFTGLIFGNARDSSQTRALNGSIDDIAIWNRALSAGEISAIPEPSTYGLIGAGALAAVAFVRRRRKTLGDIA